MNIEPISSDGFNDGLRLDVEITISRKFLSESNSKAKLEDFGQFYLVVDVDNGYIPI